MNQLEYEIVKKEKQIIVGLAIRTDNQRAMKDIPEVCAKFQEGWQEKIKNCINDDIVCAYLEYDEDFEKPYTYIIGCVVKNADSIPAGMVSKELAGGYYAKVEVFGQYPESLLAAWEDIWDSDIDRSFITDFEVYDQYFTDENDYYFNIYLSLPQDIDVQEEDEDFEDFQDDGLKE